MEDITESNKGDTTEALINIKSINNINHCLLYKILIILINY